MGWHLDLSTVHPHENSICFMSGLERNDCIWSMGSSVIITDRLADEVPNRKTLVVEIVKHYQISKQMWCSKTLFFKKCKQYFWMMLVVSVYLVAEEGEGVEPTGSKDRVADVEWRNNRHALTSLPSSIVLSHAIPVLSLTFIQLL